MNARPSFRLFMNPRPGVPGVVVLPESGFRRASAEIRAWPDHMPGMPTPRPDLARTAGLAALHAMEIASPGYAYAMSRLWRAELARRGAAENAPEPVTFACAQGHGDDVAAIGEGARRLGARCVAFVAGETVPDSGIRSIRGTYQDAVGKAVREGWLFVSAMAVPGYTEVPRDIMQGDRLAAEEALAALPAPPTHVVVPGGQGGWAAAVAAQLRARGGTVARLLVVEPTDASPLMAAAEGRAAGLEPSLLARQELERSALAFLEAPDPWLGALAAVADPSIRASLALDSDARLLVFHRQGEAP